MSFADKTSANACYNMNVDKKVIGYKEEVTQPDIYLSRHTQSSAKQHFSAYLQCNDSNSAVVLDQQYIQDVESKFICD